MTDDARVVDRHGWHSADEAPPVKKGGAKQFVVAVRRAHDGKVYSFAATYLNAMGLVYEDERPVEADGDEEGLSLTTGWHEEKDHDSFDTAYFPLGLDQGRDTLVGWTEIPQWSDVELNEIERMAANTGPLTVAAMIAAESPPKMARPFHTRHNAERLLSFREAHCQGDHDEAWHQIYSMVAENCADPYNPWTELEKLSPTPDVPPEEHHP